MNQHQLMVQTDPSKPYLGIVGCSYSHWFYGDCELKSYPALIAKKFPQYNVIDLSIISGSNESAFFRLHNFEQKYDQNIVEYKLLNEDSDIEKYFLSNPIKFSKYDYGIQKIYNI